MQRHHARQQVRHVKKADISFASLVESNIPDRYVFVIYQSQLTHCPGENICFFLVIVNEMPNLQALKRKPIRHTIPGSIEQLDFEYVRHGTVKAQAELKTVSTEFAH